jgi:hypothetical protein
MLSYLPWRVFDDLVAAHGADKWVRTLSTKCQFVALLIGQLSGFCGLRETVSGADANAQRPSAVFEALFAALVAQAGRGLRRTLDGATYLIDSTSLRLNQHCADWARYSAMVCGAKVHVIHDPNAEHPGYAAFSTATVNDISAAHDMPIVAGATYVFDLGYYDYGWWAKRHAPDEEHAADADQRAADPTRRDGHVQCDNPVGSHWPSAGTPGRPPQQPNVQ